MIGIIVGDKPCEFTDVIIIIGKCIPPLDLEGISDLMMFLKTPDDKRNEFHRKYNLNFLSLKDVLTAALAEWRLRCSNDATLTRLISYLRECSLNSYADALEKKYYPDTQATSFEKPSRSVQVSVASRPSVYCTNLENQTLLQSTRHHSVTNNNCRKTSSHELIPQDAYSCLSKYIAYVCVVVFMIALIFPVIGYLMDTFETKNVEMNMSSESSALQLKHKVDTTNNDSTTGTHDHLIPGHCKQLLVNSFRDNVNQTVDIENTDSVCLYLHVNVSKYWNQIDSLLKPPQVREITFIGCVPLDWLHMLLTKFTFVEKLKFAEEVGCESKFNGINNSTQFHTKHKHTSNPETRKKLILNYLFIVEFHNISCCLSLFNFFIENVSMFQLNTIQIANVIAPSSVVHQIRAFLKLVRHSLEALSFSGVVWEISPFQDLNYVFPKLHELTYDLNFFNEKVSNLVGMINVTAPNLKCFKSLEGYLPYKENIVILGLKHVEYLQYGIVVPEYLHEFDVSVYTDRLPFVKYLELKLLIDSTNGFTILGEHDVQRFINIRLHSSYVQAV